MQTRHKQKGLALLMLVFIVALALTGYAIKLYNSTTLKAEQSKRTILSLNEAKQALISWAVSNSFNPGQMPYPDRLEAVSPNYDGKSDCLPSTTAFDYSFLIGQLPIYGQTSPCISPQTGLGINTKDAQGNRLWYAVSRNLVHKYDTPSASPVINPGIINTPSYNWLRVLDKNGTPISEKVAAVIIAPGNSIGVQNRVGTASVDNFLDTFGIFSNYDYDTADEDFFMVEGVAEVNDRLVFITINELISALEKRTILEAKNSLAGYYQSSGGTGNQFYPYAAALTDANNVCEDDLLVGHLPVDTALPSTCAHPNSGLANLPAWFIVNRWQDFISYALSQNCFDTLVCASDDILVGGL